MTENADLANVPEATSVPKKRTRVPVVWIIPIVAALVGVGIVVQQYLSEGPTIRLSFRAAEGIEPGKTFIKYKDVEIGKVTAVALSEDFSKIVVTAKMAKHAEGLLVEDTRFWIVKPRATLSGVSGLGTLLSGNYIGIEPGKSRRKQHNFVGLEVPPPATIGLPGREFVLQADTLGSMVIGSPVYYRRLNAGQVIGYEMAADRKSVDIRIFIDAPYDNYVTSNTRFWESSGIRASVGANGLDVQTESVLAVLIGGISFETPPAEEPAAPAAANRIFRLHANRAAALAPPLAESETYVFYFSESVRGLPVGAPVTFLGMPIGEVTEVGIEFDPATQIVRTRVQAATFFYRLAAAMEKSSAARAKAMDRQARAAFIDRMVAEKGLRAQLRSGSIIGGQMYIAIEFFPDAPTAKLDRTKAPPRFPVVPGEMAELESKLKNIVEKLDKVPVEEIGNDLKKAIGTLDRTLARVEGETLPETKKTLEDLRRAIVAAERAVSNTDNTLLGPDAPAQQELRDALKEIARAARGIGVLADYLERNPETIIRGKNKENP
ncbi:MAG: MlaD family protein [Deltaproteobacteria bacterium]|nr:MlaD family protein [Candidatus Deferrimicrobium borealis]